ncbi:hypothetical protein H5T54_00120 [Candidatus Bipolaricaulota bacterium]|nr:hypothetical protein [Candidatus Bipolaricaulota bacterium]
MRTLALGIAIGLGVWAGFLDVTGTKDRLVEVATDLGAPPAALAELEAALANVPDAVPFPLLGGLVALPLPIGTLAVEGALLTDGALVAMGLWPSGGVDLVDPPLAVDLALTAYRVGLSWKVGLDLGFVAAGVGVGGAVFGGSILPAVTTTHPDLGPILAAIPWDGITWSAGGASLTATVELGLPFLRLFVQGGVFLPVAQAPGGWAIRVGGYSAAAGVVIRF